MDSRIDHIAESARLYRLPTALHLDDQPAPCAVWIGVVSKHGKRGVLRYSIHCEHDQCRPPLILRSANDCRAAGRRAGLRNLSALLRKACRSAVFPVRPPPKLACPRSNRTQPCAIVRFLAAAASVPSIDLCPFHRTCLAGKPSTGRFSYPPTLQRQYVCSATLICRIASRRGIPRPVRTSTCRNFVTISSGFGRLFAMCFLRFPKHSGGPLHWGRIRSNSRSLRRWSGALPSAWWLGALRLDHLRPGQTGAPLAPARAPLRS